MTDIVLTEDHARRILTVVDAGLVSGLGEPIPGKMCVEAAICYSLGLPHGDKPTCVAEFIRSDKIALNDKNWSSHTARAKGLRRVAIAQLGSLHVDRLQWFGYIQEQTIRRILPLAMRSVAAMKGMPESHKQTILDAAARCESEGTIESSRDARTILYAYAAAAAADAAYAYAAYAYAAYAYAAYAYAAYAYAAYAYAAAAADAAADAKRDEVLGLAAEIRVEACVLCNTEGSQWLWLTEEGTR